MSWGYWGALTAAEAAADAQVMFRCYCRGAAAARAGQPLAANPWDPERYAPNREAWERGWRWAAHRERGESGLTAERGRS